MIKDFYPKQFFSKLNNNHLMHQFMFWFYGNLQVFSISIGYVGPANGLSFINSAVAEFLGLVFGTLFMALHAIQGPVTRLSQMVQSRYQFGNYGNILPSVAAIIMFLSFAIINCVFISDAVFKIFNIDKYFTIFLALFSAFVVSLFGHVNIIRIFKFLTYISLPLLVIFTVYVFTRNFLVTAQGNFTIIGFVITFSVAASFNITFAPYVSDYTRELSETSNSLHLGASVFFGGLVSALWLSILGSWLSVHGYSHNPLFDIYSLGNSLVNHFGLFLLLIFSVSLIGNLAINIYSCSVTMLSSVKSIGVFKKKSVINSKNTYLLFTICILAVIVTNVSDTPIVALVSTLLTILLFLLSPWTGINLVDFYFRKKRGLSYDINVKNFSWPGIFSYLFGIIISLLFINAPPIIKGPFSIYNIFSQLGWVIGLTLSSLSFYLLLLWKYQWGYQYEKQN